MSICRFLSISFTVIIIHILSEWHAKFRTCVASFRSFVSCFRDVFQAITRQRWLSHFIWKTLKMSKSFRSLMHISRNLFLCPCLPFIMVIYFISKKRIPCTTLLPQNETRIQMKFMLAYLMQTISDSFPVLWPITRTAAVTRNGHSISLPHHFTY